MYPGYGFGNVTANSQLDLTRAAREGAGEGPSPYDPLMTAGKQMQLTPEQYAQGMTMRWGPNWQQQAAGAPGQNGTPAFDPFGAATNHIFGQPAAEVPGNAGGVQAPGTAVAPAQHQPRQPEPYNAAPFTPSQQHQAKGNSDEYGNGGIFMPATGGP